MIYAHINDAKSYSGLGEAFVWAFTQLARPDLKDQPVGKTELIPGKAWYSISDTPTKLLENAVFENHREFVDIQMTLVGDELMGYAPLHKLTPIDEYNEQRDIRHYRGEGPMLDCTNGMFAVFFPEDGHQPCVAPGAVGTVKKVVVKIHKSLIAKS